MKTFTESDEPITTSEIARRLNETVRRVRETYVALVRREPDNPELKPLRHSCLGTVSMLLNAATANRIAERIEELSRGKR